MNDVYVDSSFSGSRSHMLFRHYIQTLPGVGGYTYPHGQKNLCSHTGYLMPLRYGLSPGKCTYRRDVQSLVTPVRGSTW